MKNQLLKLRKAEGYIGIETMIIAALVIAAGFIALTAVMDDLSTTALRVNYNIVYEDFHTFRVGN